MSGMPDLKELHLLLTYRCDLECDHCFVWSSPRSWATMDLSQIKEIVDQATELETVRTIYFDGGEPFLYFPLLVAGVEYAHRNGFDVGIVTNGYWGNSEEGARLWLEPLLDKGIVDLSISIDDYHDEGRGIENARTAEKAARAACLPVNVLTVEKAGASSKDTGTLFFRGRAAEKLTKEVDKHPVEEIGECPEHPPNIRRLHVDPYGNVLFCQGISIGNMNFESLTKIIGSFEADKHPIIGPLINGGLKELARKAGFSPDGKYADACHLCYAIRSDLISRRMYRFILKPLQAYGMEGMD
jgi:hypothetical protein